MAFLIEHQESGCARPRRAARPPSPQLSVRRLGREDEAEVLAFLARRPVETICMAGLVYDNGLDSTSNRGAFYGCREARGRLRGVALFGHHTLIEARTERVVRAFARHARTHRPRYMIMGERERVRAFWRCYAEGRLSPRHTCETELLEKRLPAEAEKSACELRPARPEDLACVVPVNAQIISDAHRINPLERDAEGFRRRIAERISRGRIILLTEGARLLFKAEVSAQTHAVTYVEGIYVAPELRGTGFSKDCMAQLETYLSGRARFICGLADVCNERARAFYRRAGYAVRTHFETIFVS